MSSKPPNKKLQPMQILLCCEFYHPSRGGVQEVMRQVAERLATWGHDVTVATTQLSARNYNELNGVKIVQFDVSGNAVNGINGEVERYQAFLRDFSGDAIMIKAAQQWTFDAAWPALDGITARKIFIPCGFSCLYEPEYKEYYKRIPYILEKFDRLIFYANNYRDINLAREKKLRKLTVLPNGASDVEFNQSADPTFRSRYGISDEDFLILTVGTPINAKGHTELAEAFALLHGTEDRPMTLLLNGHWSSPYVPKSTAVSESIGNEHTEGGNAEGHAERLDVATMEPDFIQHGILSRAIAVLQRDGPAAFVGRTARSAYWRTRAGATAVARILASRLKRIAHGLGTTVKGVEEKSPPKALTIDDAIGIANSQPGKKVLKTHMSREDTIQAFLNSDLFVFASNIEYSPIVLYEAAAAGLPFLSVPVGNAEEIADWTDGGIICPADRDQRGYTRVDPAVLAKHVARLMDDADLRQTLGRSGRAAWSREFNWTAIAHRYETILRGDEEDLSDMSRLPGEVSEMQ